MKNNGLCVVVLSSFVGFSSSTLLFKGLSSEYGVLALALLIFSFIGLVVCIVRRKKELKELHSVDNDSAMPTRNMFDGIEMLQRFSRKVGSLTRQRDEARRSHKHAEKGRQFAEQILEAVLNNHQIAALLIDRNGKIIEANDSVLTIVGSRREKVIHRNVEFLTCFPFLRDIYKRNWLAELSANGPAILGRSHEGIIYSHNGGISLRCDWEMKEITLDNQRMYLAFIQPSIGQVVKKRFTLVKSSYEPRAKRRPPAQPL
ncbi:PAS domain S-box protein [Marinomonas mediterranea]|uniref:PAS domain-containing protein n=1 Tax=Marinomonas mediterranea TaxID=119864 RepID=UPI00234A8E4A|nr:PAS domain-containing protein [Marinomonas mediterranea]WCN13607.1 PAS domain S-box protein [Marinomonas mediterranea]